MFCPNCGTDNPGGSRFCAECGTVFDAESAIPETPVVIEEQSAEKSIPEQTVDQIIEEIVPKRLGEQSIPEQTAEQIIEEIVSKHTIEQSIPEQPIEQSIPEQPIEQSIPEQPIEQSIPEQPVEQSIPEQLVEQSIPEQPVEQSIPELPIEQAIPEQPMPQYQQPVPQYQQMPYGSPYPQPPMIPRPPRKPMSPKTKKMVIIGSSCGAVLVAFLIVLFAAIIPNSGLKGKLRHVWRRSDSYGNQEVMNLKSKTLTSGETSYPIINWQAKGDRMTFTYTDSYGFVSDREIYVVAFSPDGKKLYVFDADGYKDGNRPDMVFIRAD